MTAPPAHSALSTLCWQTEIRCRAASLGACRVLGSPACARCCSTPPTVPQSPNLLIAAACTTRCSDGSGGSQRARPGARPAPWAHLVQVGVPELHSPVRGCRHKGARMAQVPPHGVDRHVVPSVAGQILRRVRGAALVQGAALGAHHEQVVLRLRERAARMSQPSAIASAA